MDISPLSQAPGLAPFEDTYRFAAFTVIRFTAFSAHALLFGVAVISLLVLRPAFASLREDWSRARIRVGLRLEGLVQASLIASAVASVAAIVLQTVLVAEAQGGDVTADAFLGTLETAFGRWQLFRLPLLVALAVLLSGRVATDALAGAGDDRKSARPLWWGAWMLLTIGLMTTSSFSGHAAVATPTAISLLNDSIHLAAGGVWFSGVAILAIVLPDAWRGRPSDQRVLLLAPAVTRFSTVAAVTIAILAATGTLNSFLHVGALNDLIDSGYGRMLSIKVIAFGGILALGAVNHFVLRRRLEEAAEKEAGAKPARVFRRTIAAELVLALLLMGLTGVLVGLGRTKGAVEEAPPRGATTAPKL